MQKVPLEKAAKGMILDKPIVRGNGVVLMGEGTELNEQLIERLKALDITRVTVKGLLAVRMKSLWTCLFPSWKNVLPLFRPIGFVYR
jgi:hypothetical protein